MSDDKIVSFVFISIDDYYAAAVTTKELLDIRACWYIHCVVKFKF